MSNSNSSNNADNGNSNVDNGNSNNNENDNDEAIGPKMTGNSRLTLKLNHFFTLKNTRGVSLNQQIAAHPDFHAPGITESLLDFMGLDPWASNLAEDVARPAWERQDDFDFDYLKVAQEQRQAWEAKNSQIMNATSTKVPNKR